jgi:hypothetical protein
MLLLATTAAMLGGMVSVSEYRYISFIIDVRCRKCQCDVRYLGERYLGERNRCGKYTTAKTTCTMAGIGKR